MLVPIRVNQLPCFDAIFREISEMGAGFIAEMEGEIERRRRVGLIGLDQKES